MAEVKKLIIYGAGGLGKEVKALLDAINKKEPLWDFVGFIDDDHEKENVLGGIEFLKNTDNRISVIVAIGSPMIKSKIVDKLNDIPNIDYPILIHPSAVIMDEENISIGKGSVITAGVVITTDVKIGEHVLLNLNTTIGHDTEIGHFSSLMPGVNVAGGVTIEYEVMVGSGANILNGVKLGSGSIIGAGAVVLDHVDNNITVVGVPAKKIK
ncbi:acetyltransferase [Fulvivirga lutimaris]|uniref:acetyltransferase n=1 Tax=Fulvivirga lutimaris TaxID=1819566 RepID=UPI0012BC36BF|nr:acetyltransferase [Fulvivirga lutimaris]MTI38856.1 acetyltransferase [Fulvivirga lutimaris]